MKQSIKKLLSVLLVVAMVLPLLAGCGGNGATTPESTYRELSKEEVFTKTIHDFGDLRVDNLDNREDTNFIVYAQGVQEITMDQNTNVLVETDYDNLSYTFTNADETLKSMKKGDVFFGAVSQWNPEGVTAKVKRIEVSGDQVTVYSEEIGLADLFEYADVCMEVPLSQASYDPSQLEEGSEIIIAHEETASAQGGVMLHKLSSHTQPVNITVKETLQTEVGGVKLTGVLSATVKYITLEFRFSREHMQFHCGVWADADMRHSLTVQVQGEYDDDKEFPAIPIPVYGPIKIMLTPTIHWGASGNAVGSVVYTESKRSGFTATVSAAGVTQAPVDEILQPGQVEGGLDEMEASISLGVELDAALGMGFIGEVFVTCDVGVEVAASLVDQEQTQESNPDSIHGCEMCFDGDIDVVLTVDAGLRIRLVGMLKMLNVDKEILDALEESGLEKVQPKVRILDKRWRIADFYISFRGGAPEFGWGECNNVRWKTTVTVTDADGQPAAEVEVTANNRDNGFTDTVTADSQGIAILYLPNGDNTVTAVSGSKTGSDSVWISSYPEEVQISLQSPTLGIEFEYYFSTIVKQEIVSEYGEGTRWPEVENSPQGAGDGAYTESWDYVDYSYKSEGMYHSLVLHTYPDVRKAFGNMYNMVKQRYAWKNSPDGYWSSPYGDIQGINDNFTDPIIGNRAYWNFDPGDYWLLIEAHFWYDIDGDRHGIGPDARLMRQEPDGSWTTVWQCDLTSESQLETELFPYIDQLVASWRE